MEWNAVLTVVLDWLPPPGNCENFVETFVFSLPERSPAGLSHRQGQQRIERTSAIEQALHLRRLLDEGVATSQKELARLHGVTSSRVSQVMGLLRLPPEIVEFLWAVPVEQRSFFSERRLREIAKMEDGAAQLEAFRRLRGQIEDRW